jgi:hypothetical protein
MLNIEVKSAPVQRTSHTVVFTSTFKIGHSKFNIHENGSIPAVAERL